VPREGATGEKMDAKTTSILEKKRKKKRREKKESHRGAR